MQAPESMAETNSESNPLLSSEETDDSMNDADAVTEVSSQAVNPSASEVSFLWALPTGLHIS